MQSSRSIVALLFAAAAASFTHAAVLPRHAMQEGLHSYTTRTISTAAAENAVPSYIPWADHIRPNSAIVDRDVPSGDQPSTTGVDARESTTTFGPSMETIKRAQHFVMRHWRRGRSHEETPEPEPEPEPETTTPNQPALPTHNHLEPQSATTPTFFSPTTVPSIDIRSRDEFARRKENRPSKASPAALGKRSGWATFPGEPAPMRRRSPALAAEPAPVGN